MTDIASYPADYMHWLNEQTGLTAEDLRRYKGSQAFQCVGSNFSDWTKIRIDSESLKFDSKPGQYPFLSIRISDLKIPRSL